MTGASSTLTISFRKADMLQIREATDADFEKIWPISKAIASAGDSYAYPTDVAKAEGKRLWLDTPRKTFVAEDDGELLGTYG